MPPAPASPRFDDLDLREESAPGKRLDEDTTSPTQQSHGCTTSNACTRLCCV